MFRKVIAAEDFDSVNIALEQVLNELEVPQIAQAKYCDEALLKIKKAQLDQQPFELLITDLSFKEDHRAEIDTLKSGEALIDAVRKLQPELKIIVLSVEDKPYRIKNLFSDYAINGYILKGRNSIPELKKAILAIYNGEDKILSPVISHVLKDNSVLEIEPYDRQLLKYIASGLQQEDIAQQFKNAGIKPSSTSSIEKRINKLKICLKANNNVHLIAIAKDLGLV
jgi:two-component system capsular synthesis response regulator RcsB